MPPVGQLVTAAFRAAAAQNPELQQAWINKSHRLGSLLPDSLLTASIQQAGELDMLIRCLEAEPLSDADIPSDLDIFSLHYRTMLSTLWVGKMYEICRVLDKRNLMSASQEIESLSYYLKLLRIPLEKYEIANDKKLPEDVPMVRLPPSGEERDNYTYSRKELTKAHIMRSGLSERGSQMWEVVDALSQKSYWIERRSLSDRFLAL